MSVGSHPRVKLATKPAIPRIGARASAYGRIMRTPEPPRHAPTRSTWRLSVRPVAGTTTGTLGEDILLARHGDRILRLRQDHRAGQTVATLRDGTSDTAPNRINGGTLALRPGERARLHWTTLTQDGDPEAIREVRLLGRLSVIWIAASVLLCALMAWGMATFMDPSAVEDLTSAYFGISSAGLPDPTADAAANAATAGS